MKMRQDVPAEAVTFQKIVVVKEGIIPWTDDAGIFYIGIQEFLLDYIDKSM